MGMVSHPPILALTGCGRSPDRATSSKTRDLQKGGNDLRCGTTHHPTAEIVVTIIKVVVITVGHARVVLIVVPRPAAHHAPVARLPQIRLLVLMGDRSRKTAMGHVLPEFYRACGTPRGMKTWAHWEFRGLKPNVGANPCGCPRLGRHKASPYSVKSQRPKTCRTIG